MLVALDAVSWDEVARLGLPANEVYAIHAVDAAEAPHVVSAIAAHSSAILSSIITDKSGCISDLDAELRRLESENDSLKAALDQVNTVEMRLLQVIEQREDRAEARLSSRFAQSLDALASSVDAAREEVRAEHARQTSGLVSLVADLQAIARHAPGLMSRLDQTVALQSRISLLEAERADAAQALEAATGRIQALQDTAAVLEATVATRSEALDDLQQGYFAPKRSWRRRGSGRTSWRLRSPQPLKRPLQRRVASAPWRPRPSRSMPSSRWSMVRDQCS